MRLFGFGLLCGEEEHVRILSILLYHTALAPRTSPGCPSCESVNPKLRFLTRKGDGTPGRVGACAGGLLFCGCWLLPLSRTLGFRFAILGKRDQGFQALGLHYSSEHMASKF